MHHLLKNARDRRERTAGFTLIELLVVITILGVLAGIVVFSVGGIGDKGQASADKTDASIIRTAEESYYANHGEYADVATLRTSGKYLASDAMHSVLLAADKKSYQIVGGSGLTAADIYSGTGPTGVKVDYAGSLPGLMGDPSQTVPNRLGTTWSPLSGYTFNGVGAGSSGLASQIGSGTGAGANPDVFISADPAVNTGTPINGKVKWFAKFATTQMVIGWNPNSTFAADFAAAAAGTSGRTWEQVIEETTPLLGPQAGVAQPTPPRMGRTDPDLDPKGYRGCWTFQLDEARPGSGVTAGFANRVLGNCHTGAGATNPQKIEPETSLVADIKAPNTPANIVDVGIFYKIEAVEASLPPATALPYLTLPASINLGDPSINYTTEFGSAATPYTNTAGTTTSVPAQIVYTITIPTTVTNLAGAISFVRFILNGGTGQTIMNNDGLNPNPHIVGYSSTGSSADIPAGVLPYVTP